MFSGSESCPTHHTPQLHFNSLPVAEKGLSPHFFCVLLSSSFMIQFVIYSLTIFLALLWAPSLVLLNTLTIIKEGSVVLNSCDLPQ